MILKQLKQLALSAPLRNAGLARFYGSPALCESLTTSKVRTRLSRDDRRALVESFVNEYRETNAGKFPTLQTIHKEVGGNYYVVRDIFQELKLKPKASVPIVAKALSEVSAPVPIVAKVLSEVPAPVPIDASSQAINDSQSHSSACNAHVIVDPVFQVGSPDTVETESDQRLAAVDSSHPKSKEDHLEGAGVSANGVPTENRQVTVRGAGEVKTEEKSSAWSNIMSFAKEFANFWRKG